jgi:hypothetical protein
MNALIQILTRDLLIKPFLYSKLPRKQGDICDVRLLISEWLVQVLYLVHIDDSGKSIGMEDFWREAPREKARRIRRSILFSD